MRGPHRSKLSEDKLQDPKGSIQKRPEEQQVPPKTAAIFPQNGTDADAWLHPARTRELRADGTDLPPHSPHDTSRDFCIQLLIKYNMWEHPPLPSSVQVTLLNPKGQFGFNGPPRPNTIRIISRQESSMSETLMNLLMHRCSIPEATVNI